MNKEDLHNLEVRISQCEDNELELNKRIITIEEDTNKVRSRVSQLEALSIDARLTGTEARINEMTRLLLKRTPPNELIARANGLYHKAKKLPPGASQEETSEEGDEPPDPKKECGVCQSTMDRQRTHMGYCYECFNCGRVEWANPIPKKEK